MASAYMLAVVQQVRLLQRAQKSAIQQAYESWAVGHGDDLKSLTV